MNWAYVGDSSETESIAVIHRALDLGMTLLDTADVYGPFTNEELVGRALEGRRERAVLATKAGLVVGPNGGYPLDNDARPEHIREAVDGSLRRLRIDVIDLYQLHRIDPRRPARGVVGSHGRAGRRREGPRARHVRGDRRRAGARPRDPPGRDGAVGALAVVHRTARRRRAVVRRERRRVHPVRAAGSRLPHRHDDDRLDRPDDFRSTLPRFTQEAIDANQAIVDRVRAVADRHGATPAQVALAWVLAQGEHIVPIPGTRRLRHLEDNAAAAEIRLIAEDLAELRDLPEVTGTRY